MHFLKVMSRNAYKFKIIHVLQDSKIRIRYFRNQGRPINRDKRGPNPNVVISVVTLFPIIWERLDLYAKNINIYSKLICWIVNKEYKLAHFYYDIDEWELYDRLNDPNEMNNVYSDPKYSHVVEKLTQDLRDMRLKYKDSEELDQSFIYKRK